MSSPSLQIAEKYKLLSLSIIRDELKSYDERLRSKVSSSEDWLNKLRATRGVFLEINNLREMVRKNGRTGDPDLAALTKVLNKNFDFVSHFRNKGIGHLDESLLKRAVQWHPHIFLEKNKGDQMLFVIEGHRSIIESCINSYLDSEGRQKVFNKEIDLYYPPDFEVFYKYLEDVVGSSLEWLDRAISMTIKEIRFHAEDEFVGLMAVAAQTDFNLKESPEETYLIPDKEDIVSRVREMLEEIDVDPNLLDKFIDTMK